MEEEVATGGPGALRRPPVARRRPYAPPRLECHGRLVDLTQFGGSQVVDSGSASLGNQT